MNAIPVSTITPGTIAAHDWYSDKGELLVSHGAEIAPRHLQILRRRNISEVYPRVPPGEEHDIHALLSMKLDRLDDLDIEEKENSRNIVKRPKPPESVSGIKSGLEGLEQLNQTSLTLELDRLLRTQRTPDRPIGPALKQKAREVSALERSEDYISDISASYNTAIDEVRQVLDKLASSERANGSEVMEIARKFVRVFITDRNILLNISGIKPPGDVYLYYHSLNVCLLAINIAASYGYSEKQVVEIGMGALLHDVGMLLIPPAIILKKARLTKEEWYEIQKHPVLGLHLLEKLTRLPESVSYVAYQTHERENRTGYPKRRGGRLIHQFAKIVQVADIYESLSSPRPYRKPYTPYQSMERLVKMTRQGLVSGEFVKAFLHYASLFPVGSLVLLNDNRVGRVIRANGDSYAKPVVAVLTDTYGNVAGKNNIAEADLSSMIDVYIVRALLSDHLRGLGLMDGF